MRNLHGRSISRIEVRCELGIGLRMTRLRSSSRSRQKEIRGMNEILRNAAEEYLVRYGGDAFPNLFRSARGSVVIDDTGREILDFTSGQMCATIGHNHPAIVRAVHEAGEKAFHMFSGMVPEVVAQLAATMARDWMPAGLRKSIFV